MKIAVSSNGPGMDSQVDLRFGRCPYFTIVEVENKEIKGSESIENRSMNQLGAAGITAAQAVADQGADILITGNVGPRAFTVFEQLGIEVYQGSGTVKEAVEKYLRGELKRLGGPTGNMGVNKPGAGRGFGVNRRMEGGFGMKIAIPTEGKGGVDERVAYHFGRCETYTILDENGKLLEVIDNTSEHTGGEGLPPELLKKHGVDILLCQGMGPKAVDMCGQLGIEVYTGEAETAKEMFNSWKAGKLKKATEEDVCEEHRE